jgi:hypothetical protein
VLPRYPALLFMPSTSLYDGNSALWQSCLSLLWRSSPVAILPRWSVDFQITYLPLVIALLNLEFHWCLININNPTDNKEVLDYVCRVLVTTRPYRRLYGLVVTSTLTGRGKVPFSKGSVVYYDLG